MTASERRTAILEVLCRRRHETAENLMYEFGVSIRTIMSDLKILSLQYPIYTVQGQGGGIYVDEKFRLEKPYLKEKQQALLEKLLPLLGGEDKEIMKEILRTFGLKGARQ